MGMDGHDRGFAVVGHSSLLIRRDDQFLDRREKNVSPDDNNADAPFQPRKS
jgi:hypothetical protein